MVAIPNSQQMGDGLAVLYYLAKVHWSTQGSVMVRRPAVRCLGETFQFLQENLFIKPAASSDPARAWSGLLLIEERGLTPVSVTNAGVEWLYMNIHQVEE